MLTCWSFYRSLRNILYAYMYILAILYTYIYIHTHMYVYIYIHTYVYNGKTIIMEQLVRQAAPHSKKQQPSRIPRYYVL